MTLIGTVEKWTLISNVSAPQIVSRLAGSEAKACKNAGYRHKIALLKKPFTSPVLSSFKITNEGGNFQEPMGETSN